MTTTTFSFRWPFPPFEDWTDQAIEGLVGQTAPFSIFGEFVGQAEVLEARRLEDGSGLWLTVKACPNQVTFEIEEVSGDLLDLLSGRWPE